MLPIRQLAGFLALSALLSACGQPSIITSAPAQRTGAVAGAPVLTDVPTSVLAVAAPQDPDSVTTAIAAPAAVDSLSEPLGWAREIARHGSLISNLEGLDPDQADRDAIAAADRTVQTSPYWTQTRADQVARAWSPDARQVWLGWGYWGTRWLGRSRHVYFSTSKRALYTVDYGVLGNRTAAFESTGLVMRLAGQYIQQLLQSPADIFPVNGREAYTFARRAGFLSEVRGPIKMILIQVYLLGPQWVFLDENNRPAVFVDARTGGLSFDNTLATILRLLF